MELYRNGLKLTATIGLDESRGSVNVTVRLLHNENDEYLNYTEQIHIRYLFDNQVKEEILPTNDNGFYIPGKPLSYDGPIELAVHLINGDIELVTNELSFVVKDAPNGTTQVDPSEFTWQQLVDQYVNAKLDTFANKLDLSKFEEKVNGSIENQNQNIESFKTDVNANLSNQDKKITDLQVSTKSTLDSQNTKINDASSTQNSKIATLESRMNTFTSLEEGSTTGDAELQDIRVGANGTTYDTAGNAVRGQYSQLKEDLVNLLDDLRETQNILKTESRLPIKFWEIGSYANNGSKKGGNAIRTPDKLIMDEVRYLILKDKVNYSLKVIKYNLDNQYIGVVNDKSSDYKITEKAGYKIAIECKNSTPVTVDMIKKIFAIEKIVENNFRDEISKNDINYFNQFNNVVMAIGDDIKGKTYSITSQNKYNAWPFVAQLFNEIICVYTKGDNHSDNTSADIYMTKSKNGVVWTDENKIIANENVRDTITGIGNDTNGNVIFWNRVGSSNYPDRFELYKTSDGIKFEKIATPNFEFMCSHIGDIINVPNVGLMCFWNTYRHSDSRFGCMISADNGLTWTQTVIQNYTEWSKCPTEFSLAYIGDNKIIAMARSEESGPMFQVTSADNGNTWEVNITNIADVLLSTPSLVYEDNGYLHLYYYDRENGKLKTRISNANDVFNNPTNWNDSTIIASGEKWSDSGNANATKFKYNNNVLVSFYSGNESTTNIYCVVD